MERRNIGFGKLFEVADMLRRRPHGLAVLRGSEAFPEIFGIVRFYQMRGGVLVAAEVSGLPAPEGPCESPVFGFHIHSGGSCTGTEEDPFADTLGHENPGNCPHPYHAGDMPPIFGNGGQGLLIFMTDRITVSEILGKTVVLHAMPDDFHSQPAGDSGAKIACGRIGR